MKHVPICEQTPLAAVDVNIGGVANVIDAALGSGVKRIIFTSSDKAVHPTNVMGASKLVGERIAIAANKRNGTTVIACTRFGNVAGSRGSVLPVFCKQIAAGGPVTLTSPDMTRFFMTKEVAVALVVQSMVHAYGGEIFVTKMHAIRIGDLADVMICLLAPLMGHRPEQIPIEVIGLRPGEKLYEELVSEEELTRTFAVDDYLISQPLPHGGVDDEDTVVYAELGTATPAVRPYNSQLERLLTRGEIETFLSVNGLLPGLPNRVVPTLFAAQ
jgi:FlaA1/EpsC-like NDP-sugar epimerase